MGSRPKVMLRLYRYLIRSKLLYGRIAYGSARKSYLQMLDPIHSQGLRLCPRAFRTSPVESLYVDAHKLSLGATRAKLSLQYSSKIKSLSNHPAHNAHNMVFDNTYMKMFDARPSAMRTFGLLIKRFLTASNTFTFDLTTLVYQATDDCAGFGAPGKKRSNRCITIPATFLGNSTQVP